MVTFKKRYCCFVGSSIVHKRLQTQRTVGLNLIKQWLFCEKLKRNMFDTFSFCLILDDFFFFFLA